MRMARATACKYCVTLPSPPPRPLQSALIVKPPRTIRRHCVTQIIWKRLNAQACSRALSYECYLTGDHPRAFAARRSALEIWRAQELAAEGG